MDFAYLRSTGIRHLERLASRAWTDYNVHDPGITILEQVCYALTDLAYRARHSVPDLLAGAGEDAYANLYGPAQILPVDPVTMLDLRKVAIDVAGVKNAWIELVDEPFAAFDAPHGELSYARPQAANPPGGPNVSEVRIRGLYRVRIEKSGLEDVSGEAIRRNVARRLSRFRGLCEDFQDITLLDQQPVSLAATLELAGAYDATEVLAAVYAAIAEYMSPAVPFHTLEEMLARGRRMDEIFEGPLLENGFIDSYELAAVERRDTLRSSDLIHALMDVPGVAAVKNLHFLGSDGTVLPDWLLSIRNDRTPRFDVQNSSIALERRGLRVGSGVRDAAYTLFKTRTEDAARVRGSAALARELHPPPARDRKLARYTSIQQQLPMVYGVGPAGLPGSAPPERHAQALQLKAYLMFFDQVLANQFAQLANVGRLFSFRDNTNESYFSQAPADDGALSLERVLCRRRDEHETRLRRMTEFSDDSGDTGDASGVRRRNRFLDHLLARFGEQFHDYSLVQGQAQKHGAREMQLARDKRAFLRDYPRIGVRRGTAFDYLSDADRDENISGLELALRRKLGVSTAEERFYVIEHVLLRPIAADAGQRGALMRATPRADPYSLQLSVVFPSAPARYRDERFQQFVEQTVREETPAHLTPHVIWKDAAAMQAFEEAYAQWLRALREQRMREWELQP